MTITIDSNLINSKQNNKVLNELEEKAKFGKIKIVGAQRLLEEMKNFNNVAYQKALDYKNISEPFTVGHSAIGSAYISGEKNRPSFKELANILFPNIGIDELSQNQNNDIMHLVAHIHSDSNYFATLNKYDFIDEKKTNENRKMNLKNQKRLKLKELGIEVKTPEEILEMLKE